VGDIRHEAALSRLVLYQHGAYEYPRKEEHESDLQTVADFLGLAPTPLLDVSEPE